MLCGIVACKQKNVQVPKSEYLIAQDYQIRLAFGSCSHQDRKQILWDNILREAPDMWIWLGDNIYGDTDDMSIMRRKYNKQKSNPQYQKLIKQTQVEGIWDDHDYGVNDGGKNFSAKSGSQKELLDFLDVPETDPRRSRPGTYYAKELSKDGIDIKLIFLDTRYFRDDPIKSGKTYKPNITGSVLGATQWAWLEKELQQSDADVNIIASSIQVIPKEHRFEKWANFPNERTRLFDLIYKYETQNPIIISGDRHIGEISHIDWKGKKIYDITSSSLTHGWSNRRKEVNQHRIKGIVYDENYGIIEIDKEGNMLEISTRLMGNDSKELVSLSLFKK